jgi:hypothetical protein
MGNEPLSGPFLQSLVLLDHNINNDILLEKLIYSHSYFTGPGIRSDRRTVDQFSYP